MERENPMQMTLRYALQTHVGVRPNNEDAAFAGPRLLALADGVGGHAAGELASSLVIEHLRPLNDRVPSQDLLGDLRGAIAEANAALAEHASRRPEVTGMATTLTAIYFAGNRLGLAHIGDSRAYLLRGGRLIQITRDDTLVQSLVDEGRLTREQARHHPQRSLVLKILSGENVDPYFEVREVDVGDRYLICSDGLSDYVSDDALAQALRLADPQRVIQQLIRLAFNNDSQDNVTCIAAEVVEGASGYNIAITIGSPGKSATVAHI